MSEQLHVPNHEHQEARLEAPEQQERLAAHAEAKLSGAETAQERIEKLAEARTNAHEHASTKNPLEGLQEQEKAAAHAPAPPANRELRKVGLRTGLQRIRRQENLPQRALSLVIHQPVISAISETAGKTVSRPSGLLGGGLMALVGTSAYLYLSKHIGFEYNYVVFLVLFVGGFAVGLVLELLVHMATASRRRPE